MPSSEPIPSFLFHSAVIHMPPLSAQDAEAAEKAIRSENLSMERLLVSHRDQFDAAPFLWIAALLSSFSYFLKQENPLLHALHLTWNDISLMFSLILLPMDSFRRLYFTEHSCLDLIGYFLSIGCPEVPALFQLQFALIRDLVGSWQVKNSLTNSPKFYVFHSHLKEDSTYLTNSIVQLQLGLIFKNWLFQVHTIYLRTRSRLTKLSQDVHKRYRDWLGDSDPQSQPTKSDAV